MSRVKTFANAGSLLPTDLNSVQDDYENAFSTYRKIHSAQGKSAGNGSNIYILPSADVVSPPANITSYAGADAGLAIFLNPPDHLSGTRTTKLRVRGQVITNSVAPGITYTFALYSVTAFGGGSAANPNIFTAAAVAGLGIAIATPGATSSPSLDSPDVTISSAGWYWLGVALSGAEAANSVQTLKAQLLMRQV